MFSPDTYNGFGNQSNNDSNSSSSEMEDNILESV